MSLKPTTREHFNDALSLPHEQKTATEQAVWYATEDDQLLAEIDFDPTSERWYGVVYARLPDGWQELDRHGDGYFDLDDAERALWSAAAALSPMQEESSCSR